MQPRPLKRRPQPVALLVSVSALSLSAGFLIGSMGGVVHSNVNSTTNTSPLVVTTASPSGETRITDQQQLQQVQLPATLLLLPTDTASSRGKNIRMTESLLDTYQQRRIRGWLSPEDAYMIAAVSRIQQQYWGLQGSVGEIGVHHGLLTALLGLLSIIDEKLWAADLFEEQQEQNIDGSGSGNRQIVEGHLQALGLLDSFRVQSVNSMELQPNNNNSTHLEGFYAFRLLSIDAGHTHELTLHDLNLAASIVMDGGLVVLDDFVNTDWLGVTSGLFSFLQSQDRLQPFYWGQSKLFLTTPGYGKKYQEALKNIVGRGVCRNVDTRNVRQRRIFPQAASPAPCRLVCQAAPYHKLPAECAKMSSMDDLKRLILLEVMNNNGTAAAAAAL